MRGAVRRYPEPGHEALALPAGRRATAKPAPAQRCFWSCSQAANGLRHPPLAYRIRYTHTWRMARFRLCFYWLTNGNHYGQSRKNPPGTLPGAEARWPYTSRVPARSADPRAVGMCGGHQDACTVRNQMDGSATITCPSSGSSFVLRRTPSPHPGGQLNLIPALSLPPRSRVAASRLRRAAEAGPSTLPAHRACRPRLPFAQTRVRILSSRV